MILKFDLDGEGIIMRKCNSLYECGRNSVLVKIKVQFRLGEGWRGLEERNIDL